MVRVRRTSKAQAQAEIDRIVAQYDWIVELYRLHKRGK